MCGVGEQSLLFLLRVVLFVDIAVGVAVVFVGILVMVVVQSCSGV